MRQCPAEEHAEKRAAEQQNESDPVMATELKICEPLAYGWKLPLLQTSMSMPRKIIREQRRPFAPHARKSCEYCQKNLIAIRSGLSFGGNELRMLMVAPVAANLGNARSEHVPALIAVRRASKSCIEVV